MYTLGIDISQADFSVRLLKFEDNSAQAVPLGTVATFDNETAGYDALLS